MKQLLYNDYITKLSERFVAQLSAIEAGHNFDYGPEFEVALCRLLHGALPQKYGVCRGYVVDSAGNMEGDDIIIFAQDRFFTLRQGVGLDFTVKEQIPIEAAYAYLEAKHTLVLEGDGCSSLSFACKQVQKVKAICSKRKPVELMSWDPYIESPIRASPNVEYQIRNPMYGVVLARYVRQCPSSPILSEPQKVDGLLQQLIPSLKLNKEYAPDLIVVGDSNVVTPAVMKKGETVFTPFMSVEKNYGVRVVPQIAYGIGLTCIQFALDWIRLGKLPWDRILSNALQIKRIV